MPDARDLDSARQYGRNIQPIHDLQDENGTATGNDILAILDVSEKQADAQPKKITLSRVGAIARSSTGVSNKQLIFSDAGDFTGDADLTWDKTLNELTIGGDVNLNDGGSFTTTLQTITPTANRTLSLPDATGTVALVAGSSGQLLWNNAGANAGASTLTYDGSILTTSGRFINSYNATASSPAKAFTGTWFTGGTATTTKPQVLIEPTGTTSTSWSTSGTGFGVNAASGFAGRLLDLQLNGTSNFNVDSTGRVSYPAGTAALPALYPGTDTNTGVWSPAADTLAWSTNGVERARLDSSGRFAIGTTSPADTFQINKNATSAASGGLTLKTADSNESFLSIGVSTSLDTAFISSLQNGTGTARPISFVVGASSTNERMRVDTSGRLLVGTATNTGGSLLQINDNRIRIATAKTPTSATDTGAAGEVCWDANYIYVCTATNTWKRAALATW